MPIKLTEEEKKAIDTYGDQIYSAKDSLQGIRLAFPMYIGNGGKNGFLVLVREIFDNSVDQMLDKKFPCNHVLVQFDERNNRCIIMDNGKGLPFKDMVRIFTKAHTSKNYTKEEGSGNYSIGVNGVGAKAVAALSSEFIAESYMYNGTAKRIVFHEGEQDTKDPVDIPNKEKFQGTKISFIPSDIIGEVNVKYTEVYNLVRNIFALLPTDKIMDFEAIDTNGKVHTEHVVNTDGIMYFLVKQVSNPIVTPIEGFADDGNSRLRIMFTWDTAALNDPAAKESVVAYCNYCPIKDPGSTNITGSIRGVCTWMADYMNKVFMPSTRSKVKVLPTDIRVGLTMAIDSASLNPIFTGQAKEKLSNAEMEVFCKNTVSAAMDIWAKNNPNDLAKVAKFIKDIATIRERADKEKVKIATTYEASSFGSGLPIKYVRATGKEHLELIICEGDSAKGPIVKCRDTKTQSIFPIRGKIISAFSNSYSKVFSNAEVQGIVKILFGCPYRKDLTVEDCKFEKVIFAADGDVDGRHICSLLERLFILYFPFLIEAGMVYKAVPPLYMIKSGGKRKFFTETSDMVEYTMKEFQQVYKVETLDSELISGRRLKEIFIKNADYTYFVNVSAEDHGLSPLLLEFLLMENIKGRHGKQIKSDIDKLYRFVDFKMVNNVEVIEVSDDKLYTIYNTKDMVADCVKPLNLLQSNEFMEYKLNGEQVTLYGLMKAFESLAPKNLHRFKGLGEMNEDDLGYSTILPENRTLIRYTVESLKEEVNTIRELEADKKKILAMVDKVNRQDLIGL